MVEFKRQPGLCEVWLSADPDQERTAVIVWLSPAALASSLDQPISKLAALVARTVSLPPEQEASAEPPAAGAGGDGA